MYESENPLVRTPTLKFILHPRVYSHKKEVVIKLTEISPFGILLRWMEERPQALVEQ